MISRCAILPLLIMQSACALNTTGYGFVSPPDFGQDEEDTAESEVFLDDNGQEPGDEPEAEEPLEDGEDLVEEELQPLCNPADCPLGCHATEPRCLCVDASNINEQTFHGLISGGLVLAPGETVTLDTSQGSIQGTSTYRGAGDPGTAKNGIYWDTFTQAGGTMVAVFGVSTLVVPTGSKIVVMGSLGVVFFVSGEVRIQGVIEARASTLNPGPGGGAGGLNSSLDGAACGSNSQGKGGGQGGSDLGELEAGGGGGGAFGRGGDGGDVTGYSVFQGGSGGDPDLNVALIPLSGGCGGGAGGGPDTYGGPGGYGGGGGGAVQISSCSTITIDSPGGIDVAGAGGECGPYGSGGGGGGSGGSILLEGASVFNHGLLAANGGGGGSGGYTTDISCLQSGFDGAFSVSQAPGGLGNTNASNGGAGGGSSTLFGLPGGDLDYEGNGGGGGGAAGRIRLNYQTVFEQGSASPVSISSSQGLITW
jgi:hypothetical protein